MGVIYSVACRDCKVVRDLDKFYAMTEARNRAEALLISEGIKLRDHYRAALCVSFLWEHRGHNCTVFNEHDEKLHETLDPYYGHTTEEGRDFWKSDTPPTSPHL